MAQGAIPAAPVYANVAITDADRATVFGLIDEQWLSIKCAINVTSASTNTDEKLSGMIYFPSWILDTEATHHLTRR